MRNEGEWNKEDDAEEERGVDQREEGQEIGGIPPQFL
jgi:hypothetical protein